MLEEQRIAQLLEELMESGLSPEDVCLDHPELLAVLRTRLEEVRRVESEIEELFPASPLLLSDRRLETSAADLPRIPGYDIESILARGGMGVVYKARHLKLKRAVAIKMLIAGGYADSHELARFRREAEAVAALRHPSIVQ